MAPGHTPECTYPAAVTWSGAVPRRGMLRLAVRDTLRGAIEPCMGLVINVGSMTWSGVSMVLDCRESRDVVEP